MKTKPLALLALISAFSLQPSALLHASPLGTAFHYQGKLADGASAANGSYDLKFTLYDALSTGSVVAGPLTNSPVAVTNGLFTVSLDFGGSVFDGNARWLEISVRTNGGISDFTTLSPRQALTPTPYALYAPGAGTAGSVTGPVAASQLAGTISSNNIATGTITAPMLANGAVGSAQLASNITVSGTVTASGFQGRGALPWNVVSNTAVTASVNNAYLLVNDATTTVALPATATAGDVVRISGVGAGGWVAHGVTWTARDTNRNWTAVASSADGTKLVATVFNGQIYTSTDAGASWTARESNRYWSGVASSADGTKLVAAAQGGGQLYTSTNSGVTWSARETPRDWRAVASSADGTLLAAAVNSGQIYTSTNSGVTWTVRESSRSWRAIASSADGTKLVAVVNVGQIYTSTNSGVTWTARESTRSWQAVASSADGAKLVAADNIQIYTSTDSGATWTVRGPSRNWPGVASSADGTSLAAVAQNGSIYTSTDMGITWTAWESNHNWRAVASSADGARLAAVAYGDQIYTSTRYLLSGTQGSGVTLQYLGNSQWQALNEILPGSVTSAMLANGAVGSAQLAANAVTSAHIGAGAVGSSQLAAGAVTTANLAAGAVSADKVFGLPELVSWLAIANPTPAHNDLFGARMAAGGTDRVLIGAYLDDTGTNDAGAAYLFNLAGNLITTFTNPTPAYDDEFGHAVAAVGTNRALIGAPGDDTGATNAGAAYLFDLAGNLVTTFTNPTPATSDSFGNAVAAVGPDKVLIAAYTDGTGALWAGAAYLFDLGGALITTFTNPTPAIADSFGSAVATLGTNRVIISAPNDDTGAPDTGAAYLFDLAGSLITTFTNPAPATNDYFGYAVAAVGADKVLIGAYRDDAGATDTGAAYLFSTNGTLLTTFTNPALQAADLFGITVAAAGSDRVLIGATWEDTGAMTAGAAYLFDLAGNLLLTFTNPAPTFGGAFGCSLAAAETDRLLIGASYNKVAGVNAGAAYVFTLRDYAPGLVAEGVRRGGVTTDSLANGAVTSDKIAAGAVGTAQLATGAVTTAALADHAVTATKVATASNWFTLTIANPTPAASDYFGRSVAAAGSDRVLVGASYDDTGAVNAGAAYLFSANGTLLTTFTNPTPVGGDGFGDSLAAVGSDRVLIGAPYDDTGAVDAGTAYLFSTDGTLLATFTNPTPAISDCFGYSVAAVGSDRVLIGTPYDDTGAGNAGAAYLFNTDGTLLNTFTKPTPAAGDYFGYSVAAVGSDRVLIGAYRDDTSAADAGAAYLFSTNGTLLATFTNPTPAADDWFGYSVAAVGSDRVLIGAYLDDTGAADAGAAYLFSTSGTLLTTFTNPTPAASDNFGRSVAAAGSDRVLISAFWDDTGAADAGAAYLFNTDGTLLMTFTNPTPAGNDFFGYSVAGLGSDRVLIGALGEDMGAADAGAAYLFSVESYNPGLIADGVRRGAITTTSLQDGAVTSWKIADAAVTANKLDPALGVWTKSDGNIYYSAGYVGIGTASPQSQLHVRGSGGDSAIRSETLSANAAAHVDLMAPGGHAELLMGGTNYPSWGGPLSLNFINVAEGPLTFGSYFGGTGYEQMRITSAGNVGIGTATPAHPLVVQKRSVAEPALMIGGGFARGPRLNTYGLDSNPQAWMGLGTDMSGNGWEHNLYFPVGDATNGAQSIGSYNGTNYSEKVRITAAGNVGIGTANPQSALHVVGVIKAAAFITDGSQSSGMTLIPSGPFTMGDTLDGLSDAFPVSVTLSAFYMDVNEVSFSKWQSVYFWATNQGYGFSYAGSGKAANHPVQTVDWYDCVKWCNARSQQAGLTPVYYTDAGLTQVYTNGTVAPYANWSANGYRLPTEAEWEKAARGGLSGQRFPWGNVINQNLANYYGATNAYSYDLGPNGYNPAFTNGATPYTSSAGYFAPNGYGLNDMAWNVCEWCWDWRGTYSGGTDPHGPSYGSSRVLRGGSWAWYASYARCAARGGYDPSVANDNVGFRCVRGL